MDIIIQNILLGITIAAPVGPASITIIKNGFKGGFFPALKTALGVISADITYVMIVFFGISWFVTIPVVKIMIFTFGCIVLLYLGYLTIKSADKEQDIDDNKKSVYKNQFIQGFTVNISNPIAVVWWLGVFGSTLASSTQEGNRMLALIYSLFIILGILFWHLGLSIVSSYSARLLNRKVLKYIAIVSGIILILYGLRFGYNAVVSIFG